MYVATRPRHGAQARRPPLHAPPSVDSGSGHSAAPTTPQGQQPAPHSVSPDRPHGSPFGDRNLLLGFGSHGVQLPGKEGTHFFCHRHVFGLKLLDVLDKVQDAGCLWGPRRDKGESRRMGLRRPLSTCRASLSHAEAQPGDSWSPDGDIQKAPRGAFTVKGLSLTTVSFN